MPNAVSQVIFLVYEELLDNKLYSQCAIFNIIFYPSDPATNLENEIKHFRRVYRIENTESSNCIPRFYFKVRNSI